MKLGKSSELDNGERVKFCVYRGTHHWPAFYPHAILGQKCAHFSPFYTLRGASGDPVAEHSRLRSLNILMESQGAVENGRHIAFCGLEWCLAPVSEHDRSCAPALIMHQESTPDVRTVMMRHKRQAT